MRFAPAVTLFFLSAPCFAQIMTGGMLGNGSGNSQTNDPVSMVFEHRQSQTLADGTHIDSVSHEYFYRDSIGRIRMENEPMRTTGQNVHFVTVRDPVAGTITTWVVGQPEGSRHTYQRREMYRPGQAPASSPSASVSRPSPPLQPAPPRQTVHPKVTTEKLGSQTVQGIPCEASRTTTVFPVGFEGNDQPITAISQVCFSREFAHVLVDSMDDPRSGLRATMLQSVSRLEPDASLFRPPADYVEQKTATQQP